MIIDFSVENFRSIKDLQTLSMCAAPGKEHPNQVFEARADKIRLLKSALIFGANASGKSNVILALATFQNFILDSTDLKLGRNIPYYEPYRLDQASAKRPTYFDMEFIAEDGIRYKYQVLYNRQEVLREELVFYPKKQEARLFTREKGKAMLFGEYLRGKKRSIESELLDNNLFLSKAANSRHEQLSDIYLYFAKLDIISHQGSPNDFRIGFTNSQYEAFNDHGMSKMLSQFLKAADLGVNGFKIKKSDKRHDFPPEMPEEVKYLLKSSMEYEVTLTHDLYDGESVVGSVDMEIANESTGTRKIYELAYSVIEALKKGGVLIVDELNNCLHPLLSEFILDLFHNEEKNPKNGQFIATAHDTTLMDPENLRRDQIWFTEKDKTGATNLYSLAEFDGEEVRKTTPFNKWYLTGRFGALPLISRQKIIAEDLHA